MGTASATSCLVTHNDADTGSPSTVIPTFQFTPVLIGGIEINTSATDYRPIQQMKLRWLNGTGFERFGGVLRDD